MALRKSSFLFSLSFALLAACSGGTAGTDGQFSPASGDAGDGGDDTSATDDSGDLDDALFDTPGVRTNFPIKHVVVIVKENHTFDNFFGTFPGAEGTTLCKTSSGTMPCPHASDVPPRDLCHEHECALHDWNGGKMDGWDTVNSNENAKDHLAWAQYHEEDIPNYWAYAKTFTLADHYFSNLLGPSFPGHMMFLAGQAHWAIGNPPIHPTFPYWGCDEKSGDTLQVLDNGSCTIKNVFPCFEIPTLPDVLPTGTDWKFYGTNIYDDPFTSEVWSMFDAIDKVRNGPAWKTNVVMANDHFIQDIQDKKLPALSFLAPQDFTAEHPPPAVFGTTPIDISVCKGENWSVRMINAIMNSDYWKDTVIFITYDDFGGWYDHVPPPMQYGCNDTTPYGLGFRLPLIIVSPYAKPHYVFKENAEQVSVPRFIEKVFHATKSLHDLDPAARDDVANDLMNAFDFDQTPLPPLVLKERTCP